MFVKERNNPHLPSTGIKVRIALVYPNAYEMGMSSYTIHLLYSLFNSYPGIRCERFFLPKKKDLHIRLKSVDTGSTLDDFDVIAFSIHYELDYMNVLWILENLGIPLLAKDRNSNITPFVIAGGSAVKSNPLILLPFIDALVFGDIEPLFERLCEFFTGIGEENDGVQKLCSLPNVIVSKQALNHLSEQSIDGCSFPVKREPLRTLDDSVNPTLQILPKFQNPDKSLVFGETFLLELNRGCPSGCRFCLTGYVNRPFRNRSFDQIQHIIDDSINDTGAKKITLIGSAVADHPHFLEICQYIVNKGLQLMIPSIRIDRITPEILTILRKGGIKSLTIAPETGTDILRRNLNKNIENLEIINQCVEIFRQGFRSIKFYFLVGLPFETKEDIQGIVDLVKSIQDNVGKTLLKKGIRLSINPFIPKFFTPYGNYTFHFINRKMEYFRTIEKFLKSELGKSQSTELEFLNWKEARTQTVLSQLDESFAPYILDFYNNGSLPVALNRIDQDNDQLITKYLQKTYDSFIDSMSVANYSLKKHPVQWKKLQKIIDMGFYEDYLFKELKNAKKEKISGCQDGCHRCGIC